MIIVIIAQFLQIVGGGSQVELEAVTRATIAAQCKTRFIDDLFRIPVTIVVDVVDDLRFAPLKFTVEEVLVFSSKGEWLAQEVT